MKPISEMIRKKPWIGWLIFFGTLVVVFLLGLLASSIVERRSEALFAYTPQVTFGDKEPRSEVWGTNFPREYVSWKQTSDTTFRSKHGGSATRDFLEEDPRLVVLWDGYAFSKDYKQSRGHYYAIEDIRTTLRTGAPMNGEHSPQPNTCWTCKSPDVPRLMSRMGAADFYSGSWEEKGADIVNSIGCLDCHDPKTMNLTITRPALIEAMQKKGIDLKNATHQELRSLVCAQCHVEYYFNKKKVEGVAYLTFPWENGFACEDMEAYYDSIDFSDWTHAMSKAPMLKAQHPDFELFQTGIHYKRGIACADCHMPFISEGGQKFTDHHIQSPLNNISNSCQVCHREETANLVRDVYERQDKIKEIRDQLEIQLVYAHSEAQLAWEKGVDETSMTPALRLIRQAQWRWDFTAASHGGAFHAPLETSRLIGNGLDKIQQARLNLSRLLAAKGYNQQLPYPDISSKDKAQRYVGLTMDELVRQKKSFLDQIVPQWLMKAGEREATYAVKELNSIQ